MYSTTNSEQKMTYRQVISEPAKMNFKLEAFKSIWKDSLRKTTSVDEETGETYDMHDGVIGEIPANAQLESIFYAYYGFSSRKEIRDKFSGVKVKKKEIGDFSIRLMPTVRDCIPNSEYYDDALCTAFSVFQLETRSLTGELSRAMEKRKVTVNKFFAEVEYLIDRAFDTNPDWEVLNGTDIDHIFDHDTRAIIYLSESQIREYVMKNKYSDNTVIVNSNNMLEIYQKSLSVSYEGTTFKVRVTSSTDFRLLNSLIGNTTVSGGHWLIEFPKKLLNKEGLDNEFKNLQNICDAVMKID